jgi:PAS domain S-box-containing protein
MPVTEIFDFGSACSNNLSENKIWKLLLFKLSEILMMNKRDPESRLKDLELEMSDQAAVENAVSFNKELSFRRAIENAIPSGIAVIDDTGRQVYVNNSFCNMFGWTENELLGKYPPFAYWSVQDMENIKRALTLVLENKDSKEAFDLVFTHKSGKLIPVHVIVSPFLQENNKTFFLANVIDITEHKKVEEELIQSQLLLRSSIESQKDTIIFSIDKKYNYLYFNKAHRASMKFAYNADVTTGTSMLDCISLESDRKALKEYFDRALAGESTSIVQTFGNDNTACYECFFNPVKNEKNEIIGCTGLARNITVRKESEQALLESETKFKEIINQINDAIIVFDEQGKIVVWNNGAEKVCELKAEETLGKSIIDIQFQLEPSGKSDLKIIERGIEGVLTQTTPEVFNQIIDSEIIPSKSGHPKNIQTILFPIRLEGYNLFCTVIRDITEMKQYEKELLRISADKDKFYSVIAQYLYNPFNLFQSFSKMIAEELDTLSIREIQKMVVTMSKSATNLYSLLDNLLQWTRLHQGKITFTPQKLNFKKTSYDAVSILKPNFEAKNLTINHYIDDDLTVYADVYMLKTILRNLVTHGIKSTDNDGQIDISARQLESHIAISVADSGTGTEPEHIAKLFDSSEIHKTLGMAEEKGTTLGLLLCKEFVEKHGGKIWVESKNGKGNEFKFTLPLNY